MWLDELKAKIKEIESVPDEEMYGDDKEMLEELGGVGDLSSAGWCVDKKNFVLYTPKFLPEDEVINGSPMYNWKYVGSVHLFVPKRRSRSRFTRFSRRK